MRRFLLFITASSVLTIAATIGAVDYLYAGWKARSVIEARRIGLPVDAGNGLRHALAAADTYALLRTLGFSVDRTARVVERLGQANEYKEFYLRSRRRRDPTREIYKDVYNNTVGIFAAVRLEAEGKLSSAERIAFLGRMTVQRVVLHVFTDPRIPDFPEGSRPEASDLDLALTTFKRDGARNYAPMIEALANR